MVLPLREASREAVSVYSDGHLDRYDSWQSIALLRDEHLQSNHLLEGHLKLLRARQVAIADVRYPFADDLLEAFLQLVHNQRRDQLIVPDERRQ